MVDRQLWLPSWRLIPHPDGIGTAAEVKHQWPLPFGPRRLPADCGRIICAAFAAIVHQHNFPHDFPSAEIATGFASMLIAHPGFYGSWPSRTAAPSAAISSMNARRSPASGR
jgi:hypothetical protein